MGRTACTEPQCLYKGTLYPFFYLTVGHMYFLKMECTTAIHILYCELLYIEDRTHFYISSSKRLKPILSSVW